MAKTEQDKIQCLTQEIAAEKWQKKFQALIREIGRRKINERDFYLSDASDDLAKACRTQPRLIRKMTQVIPAFKDRQKKFCAWVIMAGIYARLKKSRKAGPAMLQALKIVAEVKNEPAKQAMIGNICWNCQIGRISSPQVFLKIIRIINKIRTDDIQLKAFNDAIYTFKEIKTKNLKVLQKMADFANSGKNRWDRPELSLKMAELYIQAKNHGRAWKFIKPRSIPVLTIKSQQAQICQLYARMGKFQQALKLFSSNDTALDYIATEYAKARKFKPAMALAHKIKKPSSRFFALSDIACEYAYAGKLPTALKIVLQIKDSGLQFRPLRKIAIAYSEQKKFDLALNIIGKIKGHDNLVWPTPPIVFVAWNFLRSGCQDENIRQRILAIARKAPAEVQQILPLKFRRLLSPGKTSEEAG